MIVKIGNMFESKATTLVNTVNCVGVMGKGIALEFKNRYPNMFSEYVQLCKAGKVSPGIPYYYSDLLGVSVINFPTKDHWRSPSKLSYIISGLDWFVKNYEDLGITSIAFPALGCGNGGLSWSVVGPLMYSKLRYLPINIEIYAPYGTPTKQITTDFLEEKALDLYEEMLDPQCSKLNKNWLLIIYVIQMLNNDKYSLNVGRNFFQKICYVLTRSGINTGFKFVESEYGPYSSEAKQAMIALLNANLIIERNLGTTVETIVSPAFELNINNYSASDISNIKKAFDLLSRITNTDQAEMVTTVLFSYDNLIEKSESTTERQIYAHVVRWKPHWINKKADIASTIRSLSAFGLMSPVYNKDNLDFTDDWMY
jgi:O-acetyl-ADP-ribose deacetylase (regulator of RNase III)/uncharacterized protein YwgA